MDVPEIKEAGHAPKNGTSASRDDDPEFNLGALVDKHPVGTLLGALGVGYVFGGGLFTSLTRRLVGFGFQLAILPALEREVAELAGDLGNTLGNLDHTKEDPSRQ